MSIDLAELSLVVFGMIMANVSWYLLSRPAAPRVRMAEVVELSQYRRRRR